MDARNSLGGSSTTTRGQTFQQRTVMETFPSPSTETKQQAANALHDHSVLLLHALSMNETPAKTRLRMYRHLTGQPQPLHDHAPAKWRQNEKDLLSHAPATAGTAAASRSKGASSTMDYGYTSKKRRDTAPLDDEFAYTFFQGPLNER
ncbi:hypothetical protein BG011_001724 [Mortierella polycephala]|uniref:Uncharacterized protein n=1 Tax=Mortierella polycephala TaxID=41804 RepID=A0A9P6Q7M4_9FUNG|nr:hypothetical protein BG011_001724 [Mortierella polycephala]